MLPADADPAPHPVESVSAMRTQSGAEMMTHPEFIWHKHEPGDQHGFKRRVEPPGLFNPEKLRSYGPAWDAGALSAKRAPDVS